MAHLASQIGHKQIHIVGYSNGAALGVVHSLAALEDEGIETELFQLGGGFTAFQDVSEQGRARYGIELVQTDPAEIGGIAQLVTVVGT